ncbi:MAG: terminase gpA endonuclease subunit, partial [Thermoguttaceae bacterium]
RPTLALCDDPQTAESARSQGPDGQTAHRLQVINQDVQGLAGPNRQTAILVPCTVIEAGDLADQILDRKRFPDFRGERTKRLYSWPTNKTLWEEYRELRETAMRADLPLDQAVDFYRGKMCDGRRRLDESTEKCNGCELREGCMDCGAIVDWPERIDDPRNLSAVQAAMHAFYKYGPAGFAAEFQNEPLVGEAGTGKLTPEICMSRITGRPWAEIPPVATELTMAIDVQQYSLWYTVVAWKQDFTGQVVEYGIWPEQTNPQVTKLDIQNSDRNLQHRYPHLGVEGTIHAGLSDLVARMLAKNFIRSGGAGIMRIGRMLVDQGKWPNVVHAVKMARGGATMLPCRGEGIGAGKIPMAARRRKEGERWDPQGRWYVAATAGTREFPTCVIDTNWWKSFVHGGFLTAPGDPGAITLCGDDPGRHLLFASHLTAETYLTPVSPRGIPVDEWTLKPSRPDNEWLDCMVYAAVAASMQGCRRGMSAQAKVVKVINRPMARWERKELSPV